MKKLIVLTFLFVSSICSLSAQQASLGSLVTALITNDSISFTDYCGTYKMAENPYIEEVKIEFRNGKLISRTPEDEIIEFENTDKDVFYIPPFNATAIFIRENGLVKGVKVKVKGKEMRGEKK